MAEIKNGRSTIVDVMDRIHKTNKGIECCGGVMRMIAHIDGTDFCSYEYECECGNHITVTTERTEEDREYWGD